MLLRTLDLVAASVELVCEKHDEVGWSGAEQAKQHKSSRLTTVGFLSISIARVRPSARPSFISRSPRSRRTGRRVSVKVYTRLHSEKSARRALS